MVVDIPLVPLYGPTLPFRGMNSSTSPAFLPAGKSSSVANLRSRGGALEVRRPLVTLGGTVSGTVRGWYECLFDGVATLFVAVEAASKVSVWKSIDAGVSWASITPSTGPYGDTRFSASGGRVEMQVVRDRTFAELTAYDCLVLQNGVDSPRLYAMRSDDSTAFMGGSHGTAIVVQPPAPAADASLSYMTAFLKYWAINVPAFLGYTNPTIGITTASNATPIVVTTGSPHFLQDGDEVQIAGVAGNAPANGQRFASVLSSTTFGLYNDTFLSSPVAGAGAGTGGTTTYGTILMRNAFSVVGLNYLYGTLFPGYTAGSNLVTTMTSSAIDLSTSQQFVLMGASYASFRITGATNPAGAPIVVTTAKAHGLQAGETVIITQVAGNTAANGTWQVTPLTATTFELVGSQGNATYTGTGEVQRAPIANFWQQMKVSISDGMTAMVLYDPAVGIGNPTFLQSTDADLLQAYQIGYQLQPTAGFDLTNVISISLEWTGTSPAVDTTFVIYLLSGSGLIQGTTAFAASYFAADARAMGPSTAYLAVVLGSVGQSGGPARIPIGGGSTSPVIADDPRFWFDYLVSIPNPPAAARDAGVDQALIFAQLPGQTDLFLALGGQVAHWTGTAWAWTIATAALFSGATFAQDLSWAALDPDFVVIPTGLAMCASAQRLMVGGGNRFWYSGAERPFQFRELVASSAGNLLPASPGSFGIDGESIQALLDIGSLGAGQEALGQAESGVSTVFLVTDRSTSWVTGWDAISLNKRNSLYPRGTDAPWSVAPSRTGFAFVDTDRRVVSVDGFRVRPLSRDIVDDRLLGIPDERIPWIWAVERDDRVFFGFTPAGAATNTAALVFDRHESERLGDVVWLLDELPLDVARLAPFRDGAQTRLLGVSAAGVALEHEAAAGADDAGGSGVSWSITFRELSGEPGRAIRCRRILLESDAGIGTITTTRSAAGRLALASSSASIDTSTPTGPRAVKWDNNDVDPAGLLSTAIAISLSGSSPAGARLVRVGVESGPIAVDGADV